MRSFSSKQLASFRGARGVGSIYVAIKGEVFDVTPSRHLYGEGGAYEILAGREIARALATFELNEAGVFKTTDLSDDELLSLKEWTHKFRTKYKKVGEVVSPFSPRQWKTALPVAAFAAGAVAVALMVFFRKK